MAQVGTSLLMPKDRDQLTPDEPEDRGRVSAEATEAVDDTIEPEQVEGGAPLGKASGLGGQRGRDEVAAAEKERYR